MSRTVTTPSHLHASNAARKIRLAAKQAKREADCYERAFTIVCQDAQEADAIEAALSCRAVRKIVALLGEQK